MADESQNAAAVEQFLAVLGEAFPHPDKPWSYFTDPSGDAGYFGTLAKLDAAAASRRVGATSVAAQVGHVTFAMRASAAFIAGDLNPPGLERWRQSWQVPAALDEPAWRRMRAELEAAYDRLRRTIEAQAASGPQPMGGAIGAIAHVAYHLGAIKQQIAVARAEDGAAGEM